MGDRFVSLNIIEKSRLWHSGCFCRRSCDIFGVLLYSCLLWRRKLGIEYGLVGLGHRRATNSSKIHPHHAAVQSTYWTRGNIRLLALRAPAEQSSIAIGDRMWPHYQYFSRMQWCPSVRAASLLSGSKGGIVT
jgi:hypothetical protein